VAQTAPPPATPPSDESTVVARRAWTDLGASAPQPVRADAERRGTPAPTMRLRRHQRSVLGPLDSAAATLQQHAREALLGPALLLLPVAILNVVVSHLVYDEFSSFDDATVSLPEFVGGVDSATGVETVLAYLGILTGSLAVALAGGYLTVLVLRRASGLPVTIGTCARGLLRRLPALAVAWAIGHSWMVLGSLALVHLSSEDAAPLLVLVVPAVLLLVTFTLLVSPTIVAERTGPIRGLRRALRLARTRVGSMTAFVILSALLGAGLRLALTSLPQLVEQTGFITFGRWTWLVEGVAGQMAPLVVVPWIALATAHLYLQVRMDAEGLDLLLESERAFR
jgi:hypothetical protein